MKYSAFLLVVLLGILLSSCATFNPPITGSYTGDYMPNTNEGKVNVLFLFSHYRQTVGYDAIPKLDRHYEIVKGFDDYFGKAISEISNIDNYESITYLPSDVNSVERRNDILAAKKANDYCIDITIRREKSFSKYFFGIVASSLTLTIIPIRYQDAYTVDVNVYRGADKLVKTYSRAGVLNKWVQLFMAVVYPFKTVKGEREELYVSFLEDIFKQIESEGVLDFNKVNKAPRVIYALEEISQSLLEEMPTDIVPWRQERISAWVPDSSMGILVHLPGDALTPEMALKTFNTNLRELDKKTEEAGIQFWVDRDSKYPLLLISAKNEVSLKSHLRNNHELRVVLNGMAYYPRE